MNTDDLQPVNWHTLDADKVLDELAVDPQHGLKDGDVQDRRAIYGSNELIDRGLKSPWRILGEQFTEAMVIVLMVAAVLSLFIGDLKDAVAILAIVILNAVLGFTQEYRAERAMAALKQMAAPHVKVRRAGQVLEIEARELVPGDIILLEAGDAIPADARLVETATLRTQEASLTGESLPVDKSIVAIKGETIQIGDRHNMLFMGTAVTYGRGTAVIVETGMRTELGRIAELIQTVETEQTPLQRRMAQLGKYLAFAALGLVVVVFGLGLLQGEEPAEMFLTAIALAVAAVPEGLPAVVTIALALGAQRMLRRQALIRKLPAVETLGSVTTICSDKTGTLTENRMTVKMLDIAERTIDLEQTLRDGMPIFQSEDLLGDCSWPAQALILTGGALCNDAFFRADAGSDGNYGTVGDPTEGALLVAAARYGLWKEHLEQQFPRISEVPFSSERKRMTTVHEIKLNGQGPPVEVGACLEAVFKPRPESYVAFSKGAVNSLLEVSDRVWVAGEILPMDNDWKSRIEAADDRMAQDGLRVLGVGFHPISAFDDEQNLEKVEDQIVFVGLIGMMDPPRPEVKDAVMTARTAGIRPVMITGDHPLTAQRIAQDLLISSSGSTLTGQDLAKMSVEDLENVVEEVSVFARVSPEHKLNIVQALQNRGHIVAMTGDGVNDAPALRRSDIGVAMGITGTDVSKEAADMVVLDDNFATIVKAIEEGRTIYDNVRKFIRYTLTSNVGEIITMLVAPLIGMPIPLTALQILWINLVTDGLPGLALTLEPPERNTMQRPPYAPTESVFSRGMGRDIVWIGVLMGLVALGVGYWGWSNGNPAWPTMVFTTLTLVQMGNALAFRSNIDSSFKIGLASNRPLMGAVLLTLVLQLALMYIRPLQAIFGTTALSLSELAICLVASTTVFWVYEIEKWWKRRKLAIET
jgi:Ca2+-transporting ATPase